MNNSDQLRKLARQSTICVSMPTWTAIGFVDGSEKLGLWFRLPSWVSPSPDGLRSGCGTRARNRSLV